jgi:hypothetical protein
LVDKAIDNVFAVENLDALLFTEVQQQLDEQTVLLNTNYDFYGSLEDSFLPSMLDIAEERSIQMIFVLYRARHYVEYPGDKENMDLYFADMREYLEGRGAIFVDFRADERLQLDHYSDGDHLNVRGAEVFTEMLAEALSEIMGER